MDAFKLHVKEIKEKGFDTVLFCIKEEDQLYNLSVLEEFRIYAENNGLKTWATFWGLFAGESICKKCDLQDWIDDVFTVGFKNIMIDEPKRYINSLHGFMELNKHINFNLCLSDDIFNEMSDEEIIQMPVKSFGLSCYHLGHRDWMKVTNRTVEWCIRLKRLRPDDNFVFIQAFDIAEGMEDLPMIVKDIASAYGIENFGIWSFKSTAATGTKRPKNHEQVWSKIKF